MENNKSINEQNILKSIFSEYNNAGSVPVPVGGYSKEEAQFFARIVALKKIIESVKEDTIKKYAELGFGDLKIHVTNSKENGDSKPIYDACNITRSHAGTELHLNLNLSRLAKLPPEEVYATVSYLLYDILLKNKEKENEGQEKQDDDKSADSNGEKQENQEKTAGSDLLIVNYLRQFLKCLFGSSLEKVDDDSVQAIARKFNQKGIKSEDLFIDNPNNLTGLSNISEILAERYKTVEKLGYQQQAKALVNEFSREEFNLIMAGNGTVAGMKDLQSFCRKFADNFLQNSGLKVGTYEIKFSNSGDLGTYTDGGAKQFITININKINKMDNPAEVIMTLAHELTHMVDSSLNKKEGEVFGLSRNNAVGGVDENATGFVARMQSVYYKVNPHERSARRGELVALEFMANMQPGETIKKYIKKSIAGFQEYLGRTREVIQTQLEPLIDEYMQMGLKDKKVLTPEEKYIVKVMEDLIKMYNEKDKDGNSKLLKDLQEDMVALSASVNIAQNLESQTFDNGASVLE